MLTLRTEQIAAFQQAVRPGAITQLTAWLRERYSPVELGEDIDRRVEEAVAEAEELSLISRADVYSYTELRLVHGLAGLKDDADLLEVCADESVPETTRMLHFSLRKPPFFWQGSRLFALRAARSGRS